MTETKKKKRLTVVSYSQLGAFRDCPALWGFRYGEGLRPKVTPDILVRGRVFHAGLAAGYGVWASRDLGTIIDAATAAAERALVDHIAERAHVGLSADHVAELAKRDEETFELERWMVRHHFEATADDLEHQVPVLIEHRFKLPIPNRAGRAGGLYLIGDIDLVTWDRRYEHLVTHEHKSTGGGFESITNRLELDPQTAGYVHAVRTLIKDGVLEAGFWKAGITTRQTAEEMTGQVFYNVSRRKLPSTPNVNKDGMVSTAACDTTHAVMQEALAEQQARVAAGEAPDWLLKARQAVATREREGQEPTKAEVERLAKADERLDALLAKQQGLLDSLEGVDTFFRRFDERRTDEQIERWREESWVDAARIRKATADEKLRTRNPGHCMFRPCEFFDVCLDPNDATIREAQFTTREQRSAQAEKEDSDTTHESPLGF